MSESLNNAAGNRLPLVALESTVIAHGLPYPGNLAMAEELEEIIRANGAEPRTVGIVAGEFIAGLSSADLKLFARSAENNAENNSAPSREKIEVHKISRRDLPVAKARGWHGATTVATTMWIAHQNGIEVFATGGIGGVHRGSNPQQTSMDISADLQELAHTPVIVVCAGAKAILDLPATLEYLETLGVTVVGLGADSLPAFYSRTTADGLKVDVRCDSPEEVAEIWRAKKALGLPGGLLVTVPIPVEDEIPSQEIEPFIERALADAEAQGCRSAEVTPFLLSRLAELTGERSLRANLALLRNNAKVAAGIAVALAS